MSHLKNISHLNPESVSFSAFSEADLSNLFVKEIQNSETFNSFGHPIPGGLYDKHLGPFSSKSEPCGTCFQDYHNCPGHFGYIELPLPVVHKLYFRTMVDFLKWACMECFRYQVGPNLKTCLFMQVQLLDRELLCEAYNLERSCRELFDEGKKNKKDVSERIRPILEKYQKLIDETSISDTPHRNVESYRRKILTTKNLLSYMKRKNKICMYCGVNIQTVKSLSNKIFINDTIQTPKILKEHLRNMWKSDGDFMKVLTPFLGKVNAEYPTDCMFYKYVSVTPPINRPVNVMAERILENEQTQIYKEIFNTTIELKCLISIVKNNEDPSILDETRSLIYMSNKGDTPLEKLNNLWEQLQMKVDCLVEMPQFLGNKGGKGLKQLLEKKEGLIRMHMMGKRVNFSARTVITPDPYINIEEVGIPMEIARKVTIPVSVNPYNVESLRAAILNGPKKHPGAVKVEFGNGSVVNLNNSDVAQWTSIAKRLLTLEGDGYFGDKKVHRHLNNGDICLLNRQPTLHKPSIMAHTVRVLKSERTLRLHYANCKPYNADFDGDEMNVHFPQNLVAQSEAYNLLKVPYQYLSVKDGSPLSGLIQDHVIAGVKLTTRGKFFTKSEYHKLVFQGLMYKTTAFKLLPPTILKPQLLWSGKQVLSTILINLLPSEKKLISIVSKSKIGAKAWLQDKPRKWKAGGTSFTDENEMSEAEIVIRNGELLVGILDKASFGTSSYGLVHKIYELYGGTYSSQVLSSFSILFTFYLQSAGFTISVRDILLQEQANMKRNKILSQTRNVGKDLICDALDDFQDLDVKEIAEKVSEARFRNPKMSAIIDGKYKQLLDKKTNEVNKVCLPAGLTCKFPNNNLQLMVQSGAKGSTVNTMQMSCLLGQVELEGKRPPLMISGKSLPSFPVSDFSPRAGGYIEGRFLTGIRPQELFFHSMAGREGLIDTTVKTSRSGYLQRCFIKLLEDLVVAGDMTVRDASGCVIQFLYGEDGLDVTKAQFINDKQIEFLIENSELIINQQINDIEEEESRKEIKSLRKQIKQYKDEHGSAITKNRETPFSLFSKIAKEAAIKKCEEPNKINPETGRTQLTEVLLKMWATFTDRDQLIEKCSRCPDPINSVMHATSNPGCFSEKVYEMLADCKKKCNKKLASQYENVMKSKVFLSHCEIGEPVGILAAQSLGEPCTQMTLNTFHFAGRGDMNVTLGIPRIREILMEAAVKLKTPNMSIPFLDIPDIEIVAEKLRKKLNRVTIADVLLDVDVEEELIHVPYRQRMYVLKFNFLPYKLYKEKFAVKPKKILRYMKNKFCPMLIKGIIRLTSMAKRKGVVSSANMEKKKPTQVGEEHEDGLEDEEVDENDEAPEAGDEVDYSDEEGSSNEENENDENEDGECMENPNLENSEDENMEGEKVSKKDCDFIYKSDIHNHLWCSIEFNSDVADRKIDLTSILKELAHKSEVYGTRDIKKAIVYNKNGELTLITEGCNIPEMFKYHDVLDLNRLVSNDIHKMAAIYGIEAATKLIAKEVKDVFTPYSITVDSRHLSLVADFMTFSGIYSPLNRRGIQDSTSPFQKISFESSLKFLKETIIESKVDKLKNPSSCVMIGKPVRVGTGSFDLIDRSMHVNPISF